MSTPYLYNFGLVDLDELDTDDINTVAVAQALSRLVRFQGNFDSMSVAQHALCVSQLVKQMGGTTRQQMAALHHDDSEVFIGDVPSPVKPWCEGLIEFEAYINSVIEDKYSISLNDDLIHEADLIVGIKELYFHVDHLPLMARPAIKLPSRYGQFRIGQSALTRWKPEVALARYLERHDELMMELVEGRMTELQDSNEEEEDPCLN
jgi:hypothetical protein